MTLERIMFDYEICGGKPCIRGLRYAALVADEELVEFAK